MKNDFNDFRFGDLNYQQVSNKYLTMDRINKDENKIVLKVDAVHLQKTKFGYAFILDKHHVVFLKDWAVSQNYFGNEVLLTKEFFDVKEWGNFENFAEDENALNFETYLGWAKLQVEAAPDENDDSIGNLVRWEI